MLTAQAASSGGVGVVVLEAVLGDITTQAVDAIVNAANPSLGGGGGVDGAIHRAAGPELHLACLALGGCPTGEARITPGFKLRARYVIHTVGPVWQGGMMGEARALERCYANSLALALAHELGSVAFPAIGTGAYGYPFDRAAAIAVRTVRTRTAAPGSLRLIRFVCWGAPELSLYQGLLAGQG